MGGSNGSAHVAGAGAPVGRFVGALPQVLHESLAEEDRRLQALEARLASLRGGSSRGTGTGESTQAIWAALADGPAQAAPPAPPAVPAARASGAPAPLSEPPPVSAPSAAVAATVAGDDAELVELTEDPPGDEDGDWAALKTDSPEVPQAEPAPPPAAPAGLEEDPRLEAARRLLAESNQGLQELKACLARAPGWESSDAAAALPDARPGAAAAPAADAARFGLERAFRGEQAEAGDGARELRVGQERLASALERIEELLLALGRSVAAILERPAGAEEELARRADRIARLEALVEEVLGGGRSPAAAPSSRSLRRPGAAPASPAARPGGAPGPAARPGDALRRTLQASPAASSQASRRALAALEPMANDERAGLRRDLLAIGARHRALVEEHAALLERLSRLL